MKPRTLNPSSLIVALTMMLVLVPGAAAHRVNHMLVAGPKGDTLATNVPSKVVNSIDDTKDAESPASRPGELSAESVVQVDAENLELVGHIGGVTHAVAVQGTYAYVGEGYRLAILDVSDPASPRLLGKTPALPDAVSAVAVSPAEGYAYVTASSGPTYPGLLLAIDVSDPCPGRKLHPPHKRASCINLRYNFIVQATNTKGRR